MGRLSAGQLSDLSDKVAEVVSMLQADDQLWPVRLRAAELHSDLQRWTGARAEAEVRATKQGNAA